MNPIAHLTDLFTKFPGIGPRQARRFVYYLLHSDPKVAAELATAISNIKATTAQCQSCFRFFTTSHKSTSTVCDICADELADHSTFLVVEKDADLETVRKTGTYRGLYFVIGGLLPILEKNPETKIRSRQLIKRINELMTTGDLKEVILALSASVEGDNTAEYLRNLIEPLRAQGSFTVSTLARGLSTGSELEYSDPETIRAAIGNRQATI
jgi:recombination protein RecR